jgi:nucleotide-binding universal stress UspA family protein
VIAPKGYARACTVAERGGDCEAEGLPMIRDQLRVVAVGFDGGAESRAALAEAAVLAQRSGASIRVIGVDTPAPVPVAGMAGAQGAETGGFQASLHEAVAQLPPELRALAMYERGDPVGKLIERAGEGVDLLVLGSRGFGPVLRLIAGSVSVRVIRNAPCPVMVVPRPPDAAATVTEHG